MTEVEAAQKRQDALIQKIQKETGIRKTWQQIIADFQDQEGQFVFYLMISDDPVSGVEEGIEPYIDWLKSMQRADDQLKNNGISKSAKDVLRDFEGDSTLSSLTRSYDPDRVISRGLPTYKDQEDRKAQVIAAAEAAGIHGLTFDQIRTDFEHYDILQLYLAKQEDAVSGMLLPGAMDDYRSCLLRDGKLEQEEPTEVTDFLERVGVSGAARTWPDVVHDFVTVDSLREQLVEYNVVETAEAADNGDRTQLYDDNLVFAITCFGPPYTAYLLSVSTETPEDRYRRMTLALLKEHGVDMTYDDFKVELTGRSDLMRYVTSQPVEAMGVYYAAQHYVEGLS